MEGLKNRMGQVWLPNRAFSNKLRDAFFEKVEEKIGNTREDGDQHHRWMVFGFYAMAVYVLLLRGPEGLLLDLDGMNRQWDSLRNEYVVFALLGQVKGESHDRAHLLSSTAVTKSGLNVKDNLGRFLAFKRQAGFTDGPEISNAQGKMYRTKDIDDMLHEVLLELLE